MNAIVFDKVWKEYGDHVVLEQINLEIAPRSFVALVGLKDGDARDPTVGDVNAVAWAVVCACPGA